MIRRPPRSTRTDTLFPLHDALPIFEYQRPCGIVANLAVQHELAYLERRQLIEDGDVGTEKLQPLVDGLAARQPPELGLKDRLVRGLQRPVAVDELDDVIALVPAMLDPRIAGQSADDVDTHLRDRSVKRRVGNKGARKGEFR